MSSLGVPPGAVTVWLQSSGRSQDCNCFLYELIAPEYLADNNGLLPILLSELLYQNGPASVSFSSEVLVCSESHVFGLRLSTSDQGCTLLRILVFFVTLYSAIPRDYLSDSPLLRAMEFLVSQHGQLIGCDIPSPRLSASPLESMRSGGAIPPHKRGISATLARYHMKTRQTGAIPSRKGIVRYWGVVSCTGPLR